LLDLHNGDYYLFSASQHLSKRILKTSYTLVIVQFNFTSMRLKGMNVIDVSLAHTFIFFYKNDYDYFFWQINKKYILEEK